jgi:hypothetical protein
VSANEKVGQHIGFCSTLSAIENVGFPGEKCGAPRHILEDKIGLEMAAICVAAAGQMNAEGIHY